MARNEPKLSTIAAVGVCALLFGLLAAIPSAMWGSKFQRDFAFKCWDCGGECSGYAKCLHCGKMQIASLGFSQTYCIQCRKPFESTCTFCDRDWSEIERRYAEVAEVRRKERKAEMRRDAKLSAWCPNCDCEKCRNSWLNEPNPEPETAFQPPPPTEFEQWCMDRGRLIPMGLSEAEEQEIMEAFD